jgi:hypothetical protein
VQQHKPFLITPSENQQPFNDAAEQIGGEV